MCVDKLYPFTSSTVFQHCFWNPHLLLKEWQSSNVKVSGTFPVVSVFPTASVSCSFIFTPLWCNRMRCPLHICCRAVILCFYCNHCLSASGFLESVKSKNKERLCMVVWCLGTVVEHHCLIQKMFECMCLYRLCAMVDAEIRETILPSWTLQSSSHIQKYN